MSDLIGFIQLGFRHITDVEAMDHILFLIALAAIYRGSDWRDSLWVVTAFTVGHSSTLALAVTNAVALPTPWIEFLIPVTILATGLENLLVRDRRHTLGGVRYRPVFSALFGLVHGAGFANYLKSLFVERLTVPLVGFNFGIELGQVLVLIAAALVFAALDLWLERLRRHEPWPGARRLRVVGVSVVVILVATRWAMERAPW